LPTKIGGFAVDLRWQAGRLAEARIRSGVTGPCRIESAADLQVTLLGSPVALARISPEVVEFATEAGQEYVVVLQTI
jgi:alpha-L-fucosidase 2